jgi:hypothetical protein
LAQALVARGSTGWVPSQKSATALLSVSRMVAVSLMRAFILVAAPAAVAGTIIGSMDQGAEFTQCISIADFTTKTLDDDVTLVDREASGCCPKDTVPGVQMYSKYMGSQVVCGFKEDGTVKFSTGSSNGDATCTYNKCYVAKQNIPCKDGTKQRLNGCCGPKPQKNFDALCKFYDKSVTSVYKDATNYCITYHKTYKMESTSVKTDDQADGKLQLDKLYVYTPCAGSSVSGGGGGGSSSSSSGSSSSSTSTVSSGFAAQASVVVAGFVAVAFAI